AHLRAGRRSRFEHGRSLRRAAEAQARRNVHRNRARARLPHRRGAAGMNLSLRARVMLGAALWSVGLFVVPGVRATVVRLHFQSMPYVLHTMFGHSVISGAVALAFMLAGFWQVRKGMSALHELRSRLGEVRGGRDRRIDGDYPAEVQPLVADLNALLEHNE